MQQDRQPTPSAPSVPLVGLSRDAVAERVASGLTNTPSTVSSRSGWSILRDNVFTLFNGIVAGSFALLLVLGQWQDALFGFAAVGLPRRRSKRLPIVRHSGRNHRCDPIASRHVSADTTDEAAADSRRTASIVPVALRVLWILVVIGEIYAGVTMIFAGPIVTDFLGLDAPPPTRSRLSGGVILGRDASTTSH